MDTRSKIVPRSANYTPDVFVIILAVIGALVLAFIIGGFVWIEPSRPSATIYPKSSFTYPNCIRKMPDGKLGWTFCTATEKWASKHRREEL